MSKSLTPQFSQAAVGGLAVPLHLPAGPCSSRAGRPTSGNGRELCANPRSLEFSGQSLGVSGWTSEEVWREIMSTLEKLKSGLPAF